MPQDDMPGALGSNTGLGPTPPMTVEGFFAEAKRLNLRMLGTPEETRAALDLKDAEIARLRAALQRIARWHGEFPATGKFWDDGKTRQTSYAAEYGSNGERDFMRQVALDALGPNAKGNRNE